MKMFFTFVLLILSFSSQSLAQTPGPTSNGFPYKIPGKDFVSFYPASVVGDSLSISGNQDGRCIFFGGYRNHTGINEWFLAPKVRLTVRWHPSTYRTCNKRNWQSRCVRHTQHVNPQGAWLETVADGGQRKVLDPVELKWPNNLENQWIQLPSGHGFGDLKALEFRVCAPYGGPFFEVTIHEVEYFLSSNRRRG